MKKVNHAIILVVCNIVCGISVIKHVVQNVNNVVIQKCIVIHYCVFRWIRDNNVIIQNSGVVVVNVVHNAGHDSFVNHSL